MKEILEEVKDDPYVGKYIVIKDITYFSSNHGID